MSKTIMMDTYYRRDLIKNPKLATLCISFSTVKRKYHMKNEPYCVDEEIQIKKPTKTFGGILFVDVPKDKMKTYLEDMRNFLQYAFVSGGVSIHLKSNKKFEMISADKKRNLEIEFSEGEDSFVIPMKKFKLSTYQTKTLLTFVTENRRTGSMLMDF